MIALGLRGGRRPAVAALVAVCMTAAGLIWVAGAGAAEPTVFLGLSYDLQESVAAGGGLVAVERVDRKLPGFYLHQAVNFLAGDGTTTRLATLSNSAGAPVGLAGSPGAVAVLPESALGRPDGGGHTLLAGAPRGPLQVFSGCAYDASPSVDGDRVAFVETACPGQASAARLVIRSVSAGAPEFVMAIGQPVGYVHLVGAYVAYVSGGAGNSRVLVYNWQTGARVLDVAAGGEAACRAIPSGTVQRVVAEPCGIGLDGNGAVAQLTGRFQFYPNQGKTPAAVLDTCGGTIDLYSPGAGAPTRMASDACATNFALAAGRLAYNAKNAEYARYHLAVVGNGLPRRDLGVIEDLYSFDGQQVLARYDQCWKTAIYREDVTSVPPVTRPRTGCPVNLSSPVLSVHHERLLLKVTVSCPLGCRGPLVAGSPAPVESRPETRSPAFFLLPRTHRRVTVQFPRHSALWRQIRRHREISVAVWLFNGLRASADESFYDGFGPNARPIRVRAPARHVSHHR